MATIRSCVLFAIGASAAISPGAAFAQDCAEWTLMASDGPFGLVSSAAVYDSFRGYTLLFGGRQGQSADGSTWRWDGQSWLPLQFDGPPPRFDHAMTFDSFRGRAVLFGGTDGSFQDAVTWEFDGVSWQPSVKPGPAARTGHTMAFDPIHGAVVLFGGLVRDDKGIPTPSRETWTWDGVVWTLAANAGPAARSNHAMAFDEDRQQTVLYGGVGLAGMLSDTWAWDGEAWTPLLTSGPGPRTAHAMVFDGSRRRIVLTGGIGPDGSTAAMWELDDSRWHFLGDATLGASTEHSLAYDATRERAVLFGGNGPSGPRQSTWETGGPVFSTESPILTPFGAGQARSFSFDDAPRTRSFVGLHLFARADLGSLVESVSVSINGHSVGSAFTSGGTDCSVAGDEEVLLVHPATYNSIVDSSGGELTVTLTASEQVDPALCPESFIRVRVVYPLAIANDCNNNGRPDFCDLASGISTDANGDEIPDECNGPCTTPTIRQHPGSAAARPGDAITLGVQADGTGPLFFQWLHNGRDLPPSTRYAVAPDGALTINPVGTPGTDAAWTDAGEYRVIVRNACGTVFSNPAMVTVVLCAGDFNRDGAVSSQDFFDFLSAFFTGCP